MVSPLNSYSHWGQNHYIPFLLFWGLIFGNYFRKLYSIIFLGESITVFVMIGTVLPWRPRIFRSQLQFSSPCCVGINYCNPGSLQDFIFLEFSPMVIFISEPDFGNETKLFSNWKEKSRSSKSGKSKWGLSKWGLKVLMHNCPRLPTIVVILRRSSP